MMAVAAPRRCSCGKIVPYGMKCECQIARDRARKAASDRNRPSARDRGYSSKWDRARAGFLAKHPYAAAERRPPSLTISAPIVAT